MSLISRRAVALPECLLRAFLAPADSALFGVMLFPKKSGLHIGQAFCALQHKPDALVRARENVTVRREDVDNSDRLLEPIQELLANMGVAKCH